MSLGDPVFNMVLFYEVIEESFRESKIGSKYLSKLHLIFWDKESVIKELVSLIWLVLSKDCQIVYLYSRSNCRTERNTVSRRSYEAIYTGRVEASAI